MSNHSCLTDPEFEKQFKQTTLPSEDFTHEAHLRLAWIYLTKYGLQKATEKLCEEIRQFDQTHGDGTKFNQTVTVASAHTINHFIKRSHAEDFSVFIGEFPRLLTHFKEIVQSHYSFDIFTDPECKTIYRLPDLQPF